MSGFDGRPALVVGGAGFVGSWVVRALREAGQPVRVFDTRAIAEPLVESVVGDIRDPAALSLACAGVGTVFQTASLVDWSAGASGLLDAINIQGNRNVLAACREQGVPRMVYTSSIDVVFGGRPIANGDESLPYPRRHLDHYGATKAQAERETLAANGAGGVATCALRLAGVYGPGDRHRLPAILAVARRQPLPRMGDGTSRFNHVYVENVAHAHLAAARQLGPGSPAAGQAYFITDHPPQNFYRFFAPFLEAEGLRGARWSIPYRLALAAEAGQRFRPSAGPPILTRYTVASTCLDFWFSHAKAARDFGYAPPIGPDEAIARTIAALRSSRP